MKHAPAFTLLASVAVGFAQQNKDPVSNVVKEILPHQEKNLERVPSTLSRTQPLSPDSRLLI